MAASSSAYAYRNIDGYHGPGSKGPGADATDAAPQPLPDGVTADPNTLKVDFGWRARSALLTPIVGPAEAPAAYTMHTRFFHMPNLVFKRGGLDGPVFATASNGLVGINSTYTLGAPGEDQPQREIRAAKRLATEYTHQSYNYSADRTAPTTMTWKTTANLKHWDFVCCDEQMVPVARFHSNVWYVKEVGLLEFMGPKAADPAAREEIVVVALTIYHQMLVRMNNVLNLLGAIPKPKPFKAGEAGSAEITAAEAAAAKKKADELGESDGENDVAFAEVDAYERQKASNPPKGS